MTRHSLEIFPVELPVRQERFDLHSTLIESVERCCTALHEGDIVAISSKYAAISEGRVVALDSVHPGPEAEALAARYHMNPLIAQLVYQEAEHIFGGIEMGFLLTARHGVIAPNAGLDRSNIPNGYAVLLPEFPYATAERIRQALQDHWRMRLGVILTDSWLMPGRLGTTGVALATAGFRPVEDERGKADLFGNAMSVTQRGVADQLSAAAQLVMGERDEASPIAVIRGSGIQLSDQPVSAEDVSIPWPMCIYVESLTLGLLPDGAPRESWSAQFRPVAG